MRSPANMETIQIEVTNACVHACSNCTRLCGHHKNPFFMNWETFERAVASLDGFDGIIGIMGGEPTLHPEFKRFALHLREQHSMKDNLNAARQPLEDFLKYTRNKHNAYRVLNKDKGPGLWTSITKKYYEYFELIQDTFVFQCLNDHRNPSYHQPIMVTRTELGIPDKEWVALRDNCWIQNSWSASITPKGAFFCEVAAALDMLFDGPGGWPIEPGWWKRKPEDFGDQLHWCEMCGVALETFKRNANEEVDDVSPLMYEKLLKMGSPKLKKGAVEVYQPGTEVLREGYDDFVRGQYIADVSQKIAKDNANLFPTALEGIVFCDDLSIADINDIVTTNIKYLDSIVLATSLQLQVDSLQQITMEFSNVLVVCLERAQWGQLLNMSIGSLQHNDWIMLLSCGMILPEDFRERLNGLVFNPGVLYKMGSVPFFNKRAEALLHHGYDGIGKCFEYGEFEKFWDIEKVINLSGLTVGQDGKEEESWRNIVDEDFCNDQEFRVQFETIMLQAVPTKGKIIVTQSASYFLTRALIRLLKETGFEPHVISHERFAHIFEDVLPNTNIHVFNNIEHFDFVALKEHCDSILNEITFSGAVVSYSILNKTAKLDDGYQQIEKVAAYLGGKVAARVNIKRNFVVNNTPNIDSPIINVWKY